MFATMLMISVYSIVIIYSFNLLPYKWLCDYNTDTSASPLQKYVSLTFYFFPVFLYTSLIIFFLFSTPHSFLDSFTNIIMILLLSHICLSDILYMIIPDQHVILILILGLLNLTTENISNKIFGLLAGALPFFILLIAGLILKKRECIGFGDIKLMSVLGLLLGYVDILNLYMISCLLSGMSFIILTLLNTFMKKNNKLNYIPFAPFISFSYVFCIM
nr:A24 family peptidase [uncultured Aminipila sp.]